MRTRLEQQILHAIRRARMVVPGDRVAVAVSGGRDSLADGRTLKMVVRVWRARDGPWVGEEDTGLSVR